MTNIDGDATNLSDHSRGFLTDVSQDTRAGPGTVLMRCSYHLPRYDTGLFERLGIDLPATLHSALDKRRTEFLAGRALSQAALSALGVETAQIAIGRDRVPVWPPHVAGSISHSTGVCAVLLSRDPLGLVGIDVERLATGPTLNAVCKTCLSQGERDLLDRHRDYTVSQMATLIFSAKETLFKMLYPSVRTVFGFGAAQLQSNVTGDIVRLRLSQDLPGGFLAGFAFHIRFEMQQDHVLTWALRQQVLPKRRA